MIFDIALAAPPIIVMGLGLFVIYRVLGEFDLIIDATFTTGAGMLALNVMAGRSPWFGLVAASAAGSVISLVVFIIHRLGRTQFLLASLIVFTAMYSINLHIMGGATVGLIGQPSIFDIFPWRGDLPRIALLFVFVAAAVLILYAFLRTSLGLTLRAAGNNAVMARANRIDTRVTLLIGALIAGGLYGLGGALQAEVQGYADITMGIGSVIIAIAAMFLGELLFPPRGRVAAGLAAIVVGGFLYTAILTVALRSGLPPTDLRLATSAILVAAVLISRAGIQTSVRNGLHAVAAAFRVQRGRKLETSK
jgi:putative ABC transport system permease protein